MSLLVYRIFRLLSSCDGILEVVWFLSLLAYRFFWLLPSCDGILKTKLLALVPLWMAQVRFCEGDLRHCKSYNGDLRRRTTAPKRTCAFWDGACAILNMTCAIMLVTCASSSCNQHQFTADSFPGAPSVGFSRRF